MTAAEIAEAEARGYQRAIDGAIAALRERHLEYERVAGASDCGCADYLEASAHTAIRSGESTDDNG